MFINLDNPIVERKTKTVYRDGDKTVKLFVENYSKADILNEALNQARVEEGTDLNIPKLIEVSKIDNRWALVFEHKEGETMAQMLENNPEKEEEILNISSNNLNISVSEDSNGNILSHSLCIFITLSFLSK